jgi:hypothetical protein
MRQGTLAEPEAGSRRTLASDETAGHTPARDPLEDRPQNISVAEVNMAIDRKSRLDGKVVRHDRYVTFHLGEVAIPRSPFANVPRLIDRPRPSPLPTLWWSIPWHPGCPSGQDRAARIATKGFSPN